VQFALEEYAAELGHMAGQPPEEVVAALRRGSVGFARGQSQYRGVTKHHDQGKWEARIGGQRVDRNKYIYLGTFASPEGAARAYDRAAVKFQGKKVRGGCLTRGGWGAVGGRWGPLGSRRARGGGA
jgi:AP2-like factor (euAP2 lineage)